AVLREGADAGRDEGAAPDVVADGAAEGQATLGPEDRHRRLLGVHAEVADLAFDGKLSGGGRERGSGEQGDGRQQSPHLLLTLSPYPGSAAAGRMRPLPNRLLRPPGGASPSRSAVFSSAARTDAASVKPCE